MIRQGDLFDGRVAHIEPWGAGDLPLLEKLNDPEMTKHVGGPETREKLVDRRSRYEKADSRQYKIVVEAVATVSAGSATGRRPGTTSPSGRSVGPYSRGSRDVASRAPRPRK